MIPDILHNLKEHDQVDKIYESLQQDDYSEVVLAALSVLTKTGQMPKIGRETKCEIKSTSFRKKGNDKYQYRNYRTTLMYYNRAILFAPENSKALMLGYSNRSALLYAIKAYKACLNDIDICFNMGCTDQSLADKLAKRRRECYRNILRDDKRLIIDNTFFKFDVKRNPQIPCTILDVGVVKNTNKLKIVAARDIKVGTVVAQETAYVCKLGFTHEHLACFYCHKFDLNLIPCDRCCEVMFCSETCKVRCNKEFHDIECQIMHCIKFPQTGPLCKMNIKAAIKMRQKCSSWKEFTEASKNIGVERMERSSVNEIYDVNNKFSLLCLDNDLHFLYGELFNSSIFTAIVIYYLLEVPSFFPVKQEDKDEAIQAFARVMVNLCLFCRPLEIINHTIDAVTGILKYANPNFGWFSFTGKLKHCCDANLLVLGLNNQVSLLAIKPINKGDELTISYRYVTFQIKVPTNSFNCLSINACRSRKKYIDRLLLAPFAKFCLISDRSNMVKKYGADRLCLANLRVLF